MSSSRSSPRRVLGRRRATSAFAVTQCATIHRSAFSPTDLPLAVGTAAPTGGALGAGVTGSTSTRIPASPAADLLLGMTSARSAVSGDVARSAVSGDVWPASVGFASALPVVPPGHYGNDLVHGDRAIVDRARARRCAAAVVARCHAGARAARRSGFGDDHCCEPRQPTVLAVLGSPLSWTGCTTPGSVESRF